MNPSGGDHELNAVEKGYEEAKRRLQSKMKGLKKRQAMVGHKMKKYKELLRQLETEYNTTIDEMRRHKEEQVNQSSLSLYCTVSAASIMSSAAVAVVISHQRAV